ncbi:hypothetical protein SARC_18101, partial [Sphaeroforma arctica JP610]
YHPQQPYPLDLQAYASNLVPDNHYAAFNKRHLRTQFPDPRDTHAQHLRTQYTRALEGQSQHTQPYHMLTSQQPAHTASARYTHPRTHAITQ